MKPPVPRPRRRGRRWQDEDGRHVQRTEVAQVMVEGEGSHVFHQSLVDLDHAEGRPFDAYGPRGRAPSGESAARTVSTHPIRHMNQWSASCILWRTTSLPGSAT